MKDAKHHLKSVQKKVIQSARRNNDDVRKQPEPSGKEFEEVIRKPKYYNPYQKKMSIQSRTMRSVAS
jgi:hypothetical protein